ncbi:transferase [Aureitalea sp. L0-47]|uniref:acyltransferase n=1 Tax=Aureitalea sp. L0-47 TaxID=2816962 RepID=UPI002238694C|nr:transferase [Aureitalea sp. L0-47]MCW5520697.1 transferase [Aureitalea sp. L0-47]
MGLRKIYRNFKRKYRRHCSVNWGKTIYFNFKKFPLSTAIKLPVMFYGPVKFTNITGKVIIEGPIKKGMIGFGLQFERGTTHRGTAELDIEGTIVFKNRAHIGKDCFVFIHHNGYCEFGDMGCLGSNVKFICTHRIVLGNWAGIGYESQVVDTTAHPMKDLTTGKYVPMAGAIEIGNYNTISNRVSIMNNTKTPDSCVVASNSMCNRDYTEYGSNILLGGIPAKLLKTNYVRDWESEKDMLLRNKDIWRY